MKRTIGLMALLVTATSAQASNLDCKTLSTNVATNLGKQNSGSAMKLNSIKQTSVKSSIGSTKTYTFEIYMKDQNTDSYDGYNVTAQTFANGGCLVKKVEIFQYD